MEATKKYDIFISYRREGGREKARLLQQTLQKYGYSVFYDFDSLHDDVFNTQIYGAIEQAPIFILVLTAQSMDRCVNEDDWVKREIDYAIKLNRKIIPVNVDKSFKGFNADLLVDGAFGKYISEIQYSDLDTGQLYDESIKKIINERIMPVVKPPLSINLKIVLFAIIGAILLLGSIFGYMYIQNTKEYKILGNEVCVAMSPHIMNVNSIMGVTKNINKEWSLYIEELKGIRYLKDTVDIYNDFIESIDYRLSVIKSAQSSLSLSSHEEQILRRKNVDVRDIYGFFEVSIPSFIDDYTELLNWLKFYASPQFYLNNKLLSDNSVESNFRQMEISAEMQLLYFYAVTSYFPADAIKKTINEIAREQIYLPSIEPYRPMEYYENESAKLVKEMENMAIKKENNIQRAEEELSKLKEQYEKLIISHNIKQNEFELDSLQLKLKEMEVKLAKLYDQQLIKYKIEATDDKWGMWSKVITIGGIAHDTQIYRAKQKAAGGDEKNYVYSLDYMYDNVYKWIDEYISYNPDERAYGETTRQFYKNLHLGRVEPKGVIVIGFQGEGEHPVYRVGDIIIERNGIQAQDVAQYMDDLKEKGSGDPVVKLLRFTPSGRPEYSTHTIPSITKILVGYNDVIK